MMWVLVALVMAYNIYLAVQIRNNYFTGPVNRYVEDGGSKEDLSI